MKLRLALTATVLTVASAAPAAASVRITPEQVVVAAPSGAAR